MIKIQNIIYLHNNYLGRLVCKGKQFKVQFESRWKRADDQDPEGEEIVQMEEPQLRPPLPRLHLYTENPQFLLDVLLEQEWN